MAGGAGATSCKEESAGSGTRNKKVGRKKSGHGGLESNGMCAYRNGRGSFELIHPELAGRLGVSVAVSTVGGPRDGVAIEIQPNAIAVVREFVAINNLSSDSDFIFHTRYLCHFTGLPMAFGNHASTVSTDVFRVGQFCSVGRLLLREG